MNFLVFVGNFREIEIEISQLRSEIFVWLETSVSRLTTLHIALRRGGEGACRNHISNPAD